MARTFLKEIGGELGFPDQVIVGGGLTPYEVPVGYNAVLNVTQGVDEVEINGQAIISATNPLDNQMSMRIRLITGDQVVGGNYVVELYEKRV
jgi:hypothetical protein